MKSDNAALGGLMLLFGAGILKDKQYQVALAGTSKVLGVGISNAGRAVWVNALGGLDTSKTAAPGGGGQFSPYASLQFALDQLGAPASQADYEAPRDVYLAGPGTYTIDKPLLRPARFILQAGARISTPFVSVSPLVASAFGSALPFQVTFEVEEEASPQAAANVIALPGILQPTAALLPLQLNYAGQYIRPGSIGPLGAPVSLVNAVYMVGKRTDFPAGVLVGVVNVPGGSVYLQNASTSGVITAAYLDMNGGAIRTGSTHVITASGAGVVAVKLRNLNSSQAATWNGVGQVAPDGGSNYWIKTGGVITLVGLTKPTVYSDNVA